MGMPAINLDYAHSILGWPSPSEVLEPTGHGASVYATHIRQKLARALQGFSETRNARFGVLMSDPTAETSEPPLAIIAEFDTIISADVLREIQKFCWNFSHSPTVITLEPALLRVWTCCEAPDPNRDVGDYLVECLDVQRYDQTDAIDLEEQAVRALHWVNLVSGRFFTERADRFHRDGRADQMLLGNLRFMREALANAGLTDDDICHDLLARVIFVQFLFDRKDQDGNPALSATKLKRLQKEGVVKEKHESFDSILSDYDETYRLFDWLNSKFNGDLFPGRGETAEERAIGWGNEKSVVTPEHLALLSEFISGNLNMPVGQLCLWPQYAFDVIPLEFISSIYETFVTERAARDGIFYTPPHLVDFILDRVLPWGGLEWDLKVIDPACGSGIFLVKAFQRLVHRWKNANPGVTVRAETLRRLMTRNIFGVDKDPHAVRVACFSLYLAMCDEIEPRHYWSQVTFPSMRGKRLICSDFFNEEVDGFKTERDADTFDLVVGNAPWGAGVITDVAKEWAANQSPAWKIPNKDIGSLFLAKGANLANETGSVALIQSANALLFNIGSTAMKFRKRLFTDFTVESVYNLSALRFTVFGGKAHTTKKSVSPVCVIILNKMPARAQASLEYVCPKHVRPLVDEFTIMIEPMDLNSINAEEAANNPLVWSQLMWGRSRDQQLIRRLQKLPSLGQLPDNRAVIAQRGIVFGDRKKTANYFDGRKMFNDTNFPSGNGFTMPVNDLPVVRNLQVHSRDSTKLEAYQCPQLLVKLSWTRKTGRFQARLNTSKQAGGVICNQSYLSIHGDSSVLEAACIAFNSLVAVYFQFLTSGRIAAYRPKMSKDDIMGLPIPSPVAGLLSEISNYHDLDDLAFELFNLTDAEKVLIEDMLHFTLEDFLGDESAPGRAPTNNAGDDEHLTDYCDHVIRVLKSGFGADKSIRATIFATPQRQLPYRLVAFELSNSELCDIEVQEVKTAELLKQLSQLGTNFQADGGSIFHQRVGRVYEVVNGTPTIFLIKPDEKRFWTRSIGLNDGDEIALDLFQLKKPNLTKSMDSVR